jgi:hypothetical protein
VHKLSNPTQSAQKLTQAVLQVTEMLGMYQAELARILQVTCSEIGGFASGIQFLNVNSEAAEQAIKFVRLYESLYEKFGADEVAICQWFRAQNQDLNGIPLYLIVDDGRLADVVEYIEQQIP